MLDSEHASKNRTRESSLTGRTTLGEVRRSQVTIRPTPESRGSKKIQGVLEAHENGFRFTANSKAPPSVGQSTECVLTWSRREGFFFVCLVFLFARLFV